jgi:hypothetical protein
MLSFAPYSFPSIAIGLAIITFFIFLRYFMNDRWIFLLGVVETSARNGEGAPYRQDATVSKTHEA